MIALLKALPFGILLSWLVSTMVGTKGSTGGLLHIQHGALYGTTFYGSWPLFILGAGLAWGLLTLMR